MSIASCKKCGDLPCICGTDETGWAAHCMGDCDNQIGDNPGYHDSCAKSEDEAVRMWNELNEGERG